MTDLLTRRPIRHALVLLALGVAGVLLMGSRLPSIQADHDAEAYLFQAYNLQRHGVFSSQTPSDIAPAPTSRREPGAAAWMAVVMRLSPSLNTAPAEEVAGAAQQPTTLLAPIQLSQIVLLWITACLVFVIVFAMTGRMWPAYLGFAMVMLSPELRNRATHTVGPEVLVAMLVTANCGLLWLAYRRATLARWVALGLAMGVLTLSRASFWYIAPIAGVIGLLWAVRHRTDRGRALLYVTLALVCYAAVVVPWVMRNQHHFGKAYISGRGGGVLHIRAEYLNMTWSEYGYAFLVWAPLPFPQVALKHVDPDAYRRLDRANPDSFLKLSRSKREARLAELADPVKTDAVSMKEAKDAILSRPFKHLANCLPFLYRGLSADAVFSFVAFPFLFGVMLLGMRRKASRDRLALTLLPLLYVGFYVALTHNIRRYQLAMVPMAYAALAASLPGMAAVVLRRRSKRHEDEDEVAPQAVDQSTSNASSNETTPEQG